MTQEKYNNIIEKITNCIKDYEKVYSNNKYTMCLANGETLNIRFPYNNIPHLLGVNIEYLKQSNKFRKGMNTYECLKYFIDESYSFQRLVHDGILKYENIFSKYIDEKLDVFSENLYIRTDDLEYVIKYDRERLYNSQELTDICDYYIIRKKQSKYMILVLIKNENGFYYVPVTSRKYNSFEEFDKFIKVISNKQELTYPHIMIIDNQSQLYKNSFTYNIDDKIKLIDKVNKVANRNNATLAIASDYLYTINKLKNNKEKTITNYNLLRLLCDCIKHGNILEEKTIYEVLGTTDIPEDIRDLINTHNDSMCTCNQSVEVKESYSKINEENENLKQQLELLKKELKKSKEKNNLLTKQNECITEENNILKEQMNIFEEAYVKVRSLDKKK